MYMPVSASPSALRISRLAAPPAAWDDFVGQAEDATYCHLAGWSRVMEEVFGHESIYLIAEDDSGAWRGVLPLVRVRSLLTGQHLISVPYLNDGGPLGEEPARAVLAAHAVELAKEAGAKQLELRARRRIQSPVAPVARKVSVHLPLPDDADELWRRGFRAKLRSQIKRPIAEGMEARFGADQLDAFYRVFAHNMRDLGTPVLPRRFFATIAATFPDQVIFGVVYHQARPVGAGCGFLWHDEFEMTWASTLRDYNPLSPNMLLYWSMMGQAIARGARRFNFGRCSPGSSTHRFKLQWGGAEVPLPWLQWPRPADGAASSADGRLMQLAAKSWRRLPLPLANRIGPLLSPHLPWY